MEPKTFILSTYPLLFAASVVAAYQTRLLAKYIPSAAWSWKFKIMLWFAILQVFGAIKLWNTYRHFEWIDCIYLTGLTAFFLGQNWFYHLLLKDKKSMFTKAVRWSSRALAAGEMPPEYWQEQYVISARKALREVVKPEFLIQTTEGETPMSSELERDKEKEEKEKQKQHNKDLPGDQQPQPQGEIPGPGKKPEDDEDEGH